MTNSTALLPNLILAVAKTIETNADDLTALDQAIGDGDHVTNLQRGIQALAAQSEALSQLDWQAALQKIGMAVMSSVGGASGSLYGTLFMAMGKNLQNRPLTIAVFAEVFMKAVEAVKQRGKAERGEKTMLDVLIPVAELLLQNADQPEVLEQVKQTAIAGADATQNMLATKGRASFLGERSRGYIDAGAKSSQLMICAIVDVLTAT
ncbi:dihydroxyacetone kinase, L subunit [Methyloglobulus morosus KoM1]|uniref:Dihydroxyacetone kinase, L subunit n=1 Tax=Methyloglobulus morosus KoM1 TaxID=1116472 RepID=V5DRA3_9GAMM|nr:dihydroxyacetone kinase subunit DhaL [Methyloglobulus morosus]ESS69961.1 dihydroxyacetone kinase, L subunit [Methyloglobulus morosus KoM1]